MVLVVIMQDPLIRGGHNITITLKCMSVMGLWSKGRLHPQYSSKVIIIISWGPLEWYLNNECRVRISWVTGKSYILHWYV